MSFRALASLKTCRRVHEERVPQAAWLTNDSLVTSHVWWLRYIQVFDHCPVAWTSRTDFGRLERMRELVGTVVCFKSNLGEECALAVVLFKVVLLSLRTTWPMTRSSERPGSGEKNKGWRGWQGFNF